MRRQPVPGCFLDSEAMRKLSQSISSLFRRMPRQWRISE